MSLNLASKIYKLLLCVDIDPTIDPLKTWMSRCYLGDPKDSRPIRTKCFSTYDDDIDKVLHMIDVIDDEIDATKSTKMGVDVVGSDARCSGIGPNMRDEMGAKIGVEVDEMEK